MADPAQTPDDSPGWMDNLTSSVKGFFQPADTTPIFDPTPYHKFIDNAVQRGDLPEEVGHAYKGQMTALKEVFDKAPLPRQGNESPAQNFARAGLQGIASGLFRAGGASPESIMQYNMHANDVAQENERAYYQARAGLWNAANSPGLATVEGLPSRILALGFGKDYLARHAARAPAGSPLADKKAGEGNAPTKGEKEVEAAPPSQIYPTSNFEGQHEVMSPPPAAPAAVAGAPPAAPNQPTKGPGANAAEGGPPVSNHLPGEDWVPTAKEAAELNEPNNQYGAAFRARTSNDPRYQNMTAPEYYALYHPRAAYVQPEAPLIPGQGPAEERNVGGTQFYLKSYADLYRQQLMANAQEIAYGPSGGASGVNPGAGIKLGGYTSEERLKAIVDKDREDYRAQAEKDPTYNRWQKTIANRGQSFDDLNTAVTNRMRLGETAMNDIETQRQVLAALRAKGVTTGYGAQFSNDVKSFVNRVGPLKGLAKALGFDPGSEAAVGEALGKLSTNATMDELRENQGEAGKGGAIRATQGLLRDFFPKLTAQITNTPGGNELVNAYARSRHGLDIEVGQQAQEYVKKFGSLDENFETWMAARYREVDKRFMNTLEEQGKLPLGSLSTMSEEEIKTGKGPQSKGAGAAAAGVDHGAGIAEFARQHKDIRDPVELGKAYAASLKEGTPAATQPPAPESEEAKELKRDVTYQGSRALYRGAKKGLGAIGELLNRGVNYQGVGQ